MSCHLANKLFYLEGIQLYKRVQDVAVGYTHEQQTISARARLIAKNAL